MEKYYTVTEECGLHKDWFDYKENVAQVNEVYKKFMDQVGVESKGYYVTNKEVYIVPTEKDNEMFGSVLCAPINEGLRKFRVTSKVGKAWVQTLKDAGLEVKRRPMPILYFRTFGGGSYKTRLFDQDGKLYCSIDPADGNAPEGVVEIKASEFYRMIEESEKASA